MVTLLSGDHQPRAFGSPDVPGHNDSEARPKQPFIELGSSDFADRNRSAVSVEAVRLAGDGTACDVGHERISGANPGDGVHFRRVDAAKANARPVYDDGVAVDDARDTLDPFRSLREAEGCHQDERTGSTVVVVLAGLLVIGAVVWAVI
ncbi:MAG: hypothetical protein VYB54_04775 [Pseudomonadota bacterium]|nr:hypothetical protein [Pseudomonadota bacterium]